MRASLLSEFNYSKHANTFTEQEADVSFSFCALIKLLFFQLFKKKSLCDNYVHLNLAKR